MKKISLNMKLCGEWTCIKVFLRQAIGYSSTVRYFSLGLLAYDFRTVTEHVVCVSVCAACVVMCQ